MKPQLISLHFPTIFDKIISSDSFLQDLSSFNNFIIFDDSFFFLKKNVLDSQILLKSMDPDLQKKMIDDKVIKLCFLFGMKRDCFEFKLP